MSGNPKKGEIWTGPNNAEYLILYVGLKRAFIRTETKEFGISENSVDLDIFNSPYINKKRRAKR